MSALVKEFCLAGWICCVFFIQSLASFQHAKETGHIYDEMWTWRLHNIAGFVLSVTLMLWMTNWLRRWYDKFLRKRS